MYIAINISHPDSKGVIHSTYDFALLFLPHISDKVNTKYVTHLIHIYESPTFGKLINNSKYKSV